MEEYWNERFKKGGKIWGEKPSNSAFIAFNFFKDYHVKTLLVPGAGYGRNTRFFSQHDIEVTGIEISQKALNIARLFDSKTHFVRGDVLNMVYDNEKYDAIYCFNVLHLLLKNDRYRFLNKCYELLKVGGIAFFIVFSEKEKSYGKGREIEPQTFESKPGRPVHYFSKQDLLNHFTDMSVIKTELIEDKEDHGELGRHIHSLRYIIALKA
ncbi:MAG: class I SAM-dependent methyltransferase [Candidatus Lokiarchaeota archaeon]|nr:class I SAM-dependent methyltransferase [Candidatus Lokiarchaeota archaeon]